MVPSVGMAAIQWAVSLCGQLRKFQVVRHGETLWHSLARVQSPRKVTEVKSTESNTNITKLISKGSQPDWGGRQNAFYSLKYRDKKKPSKITA
jgi:hypothetical protein